MLTRRNFLKGLLSSVAAGALIKNGILQPEQVIAEPERRVFDMAANTWRQPGSAMGKIIGILELTEASLYMARLEFARKYGYPFDTLVAGPAVETNALCLLRSYVHSSCGLGGSSVLVPDWQVAEQTSAAPAAWWLT